MIICCQNIGKSFSPTTLLEWVQLLSYIVSGIGILIAGISYARNKKLQKVEWIESLFEKFYEKETYKEVRKWIDYKLLKDELSNDVNKNKEEKLADFLNFFEFIATLEKEKQLSLDEIKNLFAYYLYLIKSDEVCLQFISDYKFKNLSKLLAKI